MKKILGPFVDDEVPAPAPASNGNDVLDIFALIICVSSIPYVSFALFKCFLNRSSRSAISSFFFSNIVFKLLFSICNSFNLDLYCAFVLLPPLPLSISIIKSGISFKRPSNSIIFCEFKRFSFSNLATLFFSSSSCDSSKRIRSSLEFFNSFLSFSFSYSKRIIFSFSFAKFFVSLLLLLLLFTFDIKLFLVLYKWFEEFVAVIVDKSISILGPFIKPESLFRCNCVISVRIFSISSCIFSFSCTISLYFLYIRFNSSSILSARNVSSFTFAHIDFLSSSNSQICLINDALLDLIHHDHV
ncbi:hypothetical protein DERP_013847 [Dermatophagoides pteronyssinus]|uniref:Uncharacterized protein n=1 Tax=Dermatophagoides pteronyssinus TaxID=6956 RepID=A0ABQ8J361_DERPT|nr:hypothetical protein DERP_013847 [Dermatophagoides pteronyssinus]